MRETTSKLTSKGQTTIPQEIRYILDLNEGDEILYTPHEQGFIITKAQKGLIPCPYCKGTGRCKISKEG